MDISADELSLRVTIVAAIARNRVIGQHQKLPWHLPEDLANFRRITIGHPVIMGRKTWDSIGKPLPDRRNIVISKKFSSVSSQVETVESLRKALTLCLLDDPDEEVFVIGGGEIYRTAISLASKMVLTEIDREYEGDTLFPEIDRDVWRETERIDHQHSDPPYSIVTYLRNVRPVP